MAKTNATTALRAVCEKEALSPDILGNIATRLHDFAALLSGVEQICEADGIGGDALHVAATACADITRNLCLIADRLNAMASKGGAA